MRPKCVLAVGKDVGLVRQIRAAGIDQIDARQPVLPRHFLRPQMLLHRHRIIGATLDRCVVADDHALLPLDTPDAGDDRRRMNVVVVHPVSRQRRQLQKRRPRIEQPVHPLARQQLPALHVSLTRALVAALCRSRDARAQFGGQLRHRGRIGLEAFVTR
jgi:hypothetical protein